MNAGASISELPLKAKGERPYFFDEPAVDKLVSMVLALTGELSVLRERHDSLLRVLEEKGLLEAAEVAAYEAPAPVQREREAQREKLLETVMHILLVEVEGMEMQSATDAG